MARRSLVALSAALGCLLGACSSPPAPAVAIVDVPAMRGAAGDATAERCAALEKRVGRLVEKLHARMEEQTPSLVQGRARETYAHEWPPWCARSLVEKARVSCPRTLSGGGAGALEEILRDHDERRKAARFRVSADGRWIVEWSGVHHVVRVWEAQPDALRLAWLLGPAEDCAPVDAAPPGRIVCHVRSEQRVGGDDKQYLLVLDAATGVRRLADVEGWERQGDQLVVASSRRVRRFAWTTLDVTADVPKPNVFYANPFQPKLLAQGRAVLLSDTLVSMESGAVLAGKLEEPGPLSGVPMSADRGRLLPCVSGSLAIIDAATGRAQPVAGQHGCRVAAPVFTADGRHAFGVDETVGASRSNGASDRVLTPFVVDVDTGAARSNVAAAFRVARRGMWSAVYIPDDQPGRVCVRYFADDGKGALSYGPDNEDDVCPWVFDAAGSIARKPASRDPLAPIALGLAGSLIARAVGPDKSTLLLATATPPRTSGGASWDLAIAEVGGEPPKVRRVLHAARGDEMSLAGSAPPHLFVDPAITGGMRFVGPRRAVLATAPPQVIDLDAGTVVAVDGEWIGGRWAVSEDHGTLIDLATFKRFPLEVDAAAWRAVKSYGADCDQ